ncbi:MAG: triose-phosphate isomerase [Gammaproteobacteria bacterium]|nr:MAG: triose-phosphate isomerase [Gammaproteobacteria bacterium]
MARQTIVAGNWKMHGNHAENQRLLKAIDNQLDGDLQTKVMVFPPFTYLSQIADLLSNSSSILEGKNEGKGKSKIDLGAQTLSEHKSGAFTGEISAAMLVDLGCSHVLVGHSERRSLYNESSQLVANKFAAALEAGLTPILCIGETLSERDAGRTMDIVFRQIDAVLDTAGIAGLSKGIIAYEPVWAIGTGKTASPEQAQEVHSEIRSHLDELDQELANNMQILYGGSVNATNASELFAMVDIDGGLIGGAALKADDFFKICVAAG